MHIKCFKSATGINSTHKIDIKHVCVLFSGYLPLRITPPIFNMGRMLTWRAANLAYLALPRTICHGYQFVHLDQLNEEKNVFKKNTHLGYIKYNRFHGNP